MRPTDFANPNTFLLQLKPNDGGPILYCERSRIGGFDLLEGCAKDCGLNNPIPVSVDTASLELFLFYLHGDPWEFMAEAPLQDKISLLETLDYMGIKHNHNFSGFDVVADALFESFAGVPGWHAFNREAEKRHLSLYNSKEAIKILKAFKNREFVMPAA